MIDLKEIKACMVKHDHRQKDIAVILGLSENTVNKKINGIRDFTAKELAALARMYKVDINLFIK